MLPTANGTDCYYGTHCKWITNISRGAAEKTICHRGQTRQTAAAEASPLYPHLWCVVVQWCKWMINEEEKSFCSWTRGKSIYHHQGIIGAKQAEAFIWFVVCSRVLPVFCAPYTPQTTTSASPELLTISEEQDKTRDSSPSASSSSSSSLN